MARLELCWRAGHLQDGWRRELESWCRPWGPCGPYGDVDPQGRSWWCWCRSLPLRRRRYDLCMPERSAYGRSCRWRRPGAWPRDEAGRRSRPRLDVSAKRWRRRRGRYAPTSSVDSAGTHGPRCRRGGGTRGQRIRHGRAPCGSGALFRRVFGDRQGICGMSGVRPGSSFGTRWCRRQEIIFTNR